MTNCGGPTRFQPHCRVEQFCSALESLRNQLAHSQETGRQLVRNLVPALDVDRRIQQSGEQSLLSFPYLPLPGTSRPPINWRIYHAQPTDAMTTSQPAVRSRWIDAGRPGLIIICRTICERASRDRAESRRCVTRCGAAGYEWAMRDSNPRHPLCKSGALTN